VVVADYALPSWSALDAFGVLRETALDIPFIIVSGGIIRQVTFIMRDNTLRVGDLVRFLGTPTVHRLYRTAYFF
jgi:hypothetical protein